MTLTNPKTSRSFSLVCRKALMIEGFAPHLHNGGKPAEKCTDRELANAAKSFLEHILSNTKRQPVRGQVGALRGLIRYVEESAAVAVSTPANADPVLPSPRLAPSLIVQQTQPKAAATSSRGAHLRAGCFLKEPPVVLHLNATRTAEFMRRGGAAAVEAWLDEAAPDKQRSNAERVVLRGAPQGVVGFEVYQLVGSACTYRGHFDTEAHAREVFPTALLEMPYRDGGVEPEKTSQW